MEPKATPDQKTAKTAVEEVRTSSPDDRDELLTDLLCHIYGTLPAQNG
jgi:hypothetical protein